MARRKGRPRRRGDDEGGSKQLWGIALLALVALTLVGVLVFYAVEEFGRPELGDDSCPQSGPSSITVVLIDGTDTLSPVQQQSVRLELEELRANIPQYGLIEVYSIASTGEHLIAPEFRKCNPMGPSGEQSEWTGNKRYAAKQWSLLFAEPLQAVFNRMVPGGEASASPIMESIQSVALTAFGKVTDTTIERSLIIVSDMLEHSEASSHYKGIPDFEAFRAEPAYARVRAELNGVMVTILYVRRDTGKNVQGAEHIAFWQKYLADQGAVLARVDRVEG